MTNNIVGLKNPITSTAQVEMSKSQGAMNVAGKEITTGDRDIKNIVSYIIGSNLKNSSENLKSLNQVVSYGINLLKTAETKLKDMEGVLTKQRAAVSQADSADGATLKLLNNNFLNSMKSVSRISSFASFNGKHLLDGSLGGGTPLSASHAKFASNVRFTGTVPAQFSNGGATAGTGVVRTSTITVGTNSNAGDTFTAGGGVAGLTGTTFTMRSSYTGAQNEILIGSTTAQTAQNIAAALQRSNNLADKVYTVDVNNNVVTLSYVAQGAAFTTAESSGGARIAVADNAAAAGAVILENMSLNAKFIGSVSPNFTSLGRVTSTANGENAVLLATNGIAQADVAGFGDANNDSVAAFSCTIDGKEFRGAMFVAAANAGVVQAADVLKMVSVDGTESFKVSFRANASNDITSLANTQAMAVNMNNLFKNNLTVAQTRYINVDTSAGDIKLNDGTSVGSTKGIVATLNSTNFDNLTMDDFTISNDGTNIGRYVFTATISGNQFTVNNIDTTTLVKGKLITLTHATSGDTFTLNVGDKALALGTTEGMTAVQDALKDALGAGTGVKIMVGEDFEDAIKIRVADVSNNRLYLDGNNVDQSATLNILNEASRKVALEVLDNALTNIRTQLANVKNQQADLNDAADSLAEDIAVLGEASQSFLATSYEKATDDFKAALLKVQGAIAIIVQSYQIGQAVLGLIRG